ncbi:leukemia NUP98 fusion partner 1 isoform X1 [Hypomesus transpacificus]|uniref:leukemia NUP98 fusion partner 1 isoform X1 n=1 Tax=Hypomesus transpacificus TaxID=137520 RepID=UPI001F08782C|nr:leukemia NUP98 fusion partner 1 isoform X1 [Hypomesus transpacificus]
MALRLLPSLIGDDEDDDGNFTNWMSSYWGHGSQSARSKERKRSFRRPARAKADRRASLPCMSQLEAMQLNRLQAASVTPNPQLEKEVKGHPRARRVSSDDINRQKSVLPENRITTIPELTESFERRLRLHNKKVTSLSEADNMCPICHGDMRKDGGGAVQELYCAHRFHKEAARRGETTRPRSGSATAESERRRSTVERRKSGEGPFCDGSEEYRMPRRQLSLRRQR